MSDSNSEMQRLLSLSVEQSKRITALEAENQRLRDALEAVEALCDEFRAEIMRKAGYE